MQKLNAGSPLSRQTEQPSLLKQCEYYIQVKNICDWAIEYFVCESKCGKNGTHDCSSYH